MKRNGILNSDISRVLSYMGHTDRIALGDCGLPVPEETERIDLALEFGKPSFLEVLRSRARIRICFREFWIRWGSRTWSRERSKWNLFPMKSLRDRPGTARL